MNMMKKLLLLAILVSVFVFAVSFATLYAQIHIIEGDVCSCTLPLPLLIPTFSSFGILIGLVSFYLFYPFMQRKCEKNLDVFLDLLDAYEKEVLRMLVENKGEILQAKISRKLGKVKAYRVLKKLERRGVVEISDVGKTNKVRLSEKFKVLLI